MLDHLDPDIWEGAEHCVELVGLEVVAAHDEQGAHRFGGMKGEQVCAEADGAEE
jgi:hypothetical protein